jgi:protein tyrosine phosphatase (PTP) superfamily phosphohydrolase (DUF442 family)
MKFRNIAILIVCSILLYGGSFAWSKVSGNSNSDLVGPRGNVVPSAPKAYGFWSYAVPVPGKLSRSGQPTIDEFKWLKDQGVKSVVDLRVDNEYKETTDDQKLPDFNKLKFNYLRLPIRDGQPPSMDQAQKFLAFVYDKNNQPVHVHCRGGYRRTGTVIALYRFEAQGLSMDKSIKESRLFHGGVSAVQKKWLLKWAKDNPKRK